MYTPSNQPCTNFFRPSCLLVVTAPGQLIFQRSQLARHLLYVLRGRVAAHEGPYDSSPQIGSKQAGSVVGDLCWVTSYRLKGRGYERANNIYAEDNCAVAIISFEALEALNREHPRLGWKLIQSFTANAFSTLILTAHEAMSKVKLLKKV